MAFCTLTEIEIVLSAKGARRAGDDNNDTSMDTGIASAMIEWGDSIIRMHLTQRYSYAAMQGSDWVKWCSAVFASVALRRRRGNPAPESLVDTYDRYMEWLERIRDGLMPLPDANPKHDTSPAVSNLTIDGRHERAKVRKVAQTSTRTVDSGKIRHYLMVDEYPEWY